MKNSVIFYETVTGNCPVAEFIKALPPKHQAKAIRNLELFEEYGQLLQGGFVSHIYDQIWELRIVHAKNISRILYFSPIGHTFVLLHGFIKKSRKTPQREINVAIKRMKDYVERIN